jgi:hypothetical protein
MAPVSARKFYRRDTIHGLLKNRFRCSLVATHTHPEKTFWLTPKGEVFDVMEPAYVSSLRDSATGEYHYTAEYLSFFLVNLLNVLGADAGDIDVLGQYLEFNEIGRVPLKREFKN